jgi:NAD(P)-dependent dehydrogenase (short-subunit alcohol dehydrogenase family)
MASDSIPGRMVEGKVVVVIGAGGLLGRDFVRGIAEHGGHPVLADIVEPQTSEHLAIGVDINSKASVMALISTVPARARARGKGIGRERGGLPREAEVRWSSTGGTRAPELYPSPWPVRVGCFFSQFMMAGGTPEVSADTFKTIGVDDVRRPLNEARTRDE